ncbi:S8 family serine peptidase [Actinophytocola gossypii]|uniref:alpha-amylase n=1 Tax=Actinophytocola gossypii TaxID=2812003 RepID=A0ABT2J3D1_9PSEU|nr:S8 family serine peptidase [Actinophytocola gossypii]MCT2582206.1 S8 family serine peptidase [Actinophytocola gossypii]
MRLFRMRSMVARLTTIAAIAGLAGTVTASTTAAAEPGAASIASELVALVEDADEGEPVQALVMLPNTTDHDGGYDTVVDTLREHAADSQAEVVRHLEARDDITVLNRLWLTNMLVVEFPADTGALGALAEIPGVDRLIPNFELTVPDVAESADVTAQASTWGLDKIEAARVWQELGVTGADAKVAVLDTGVAIDHPDLAGKMATTDPRDPQHPGGWAEFDTAGARVDTLPRETSGHGTHVTGTVVGGDTSGTAIGVAPDAEYMHGLIIPHGRGSFAQVAAGMQWAVAPTDSNGEPAGSPPDVVSMSLGSNGFHTEMIAPVRAIRAAGIVPAIAIGNNCGTAGTASPGNVYEAVAVGATDSSDNVASFSCGAVVRKDQWTEPPAEWPEEWVKPDISAPGVDVYSAAPGGGYSTLSGTSMATPHTAGTAALMRSAAPDLSVDELFDALADTSFWDDRNAPDRPDTRFGHGRINAYEATARVAVHSGISGMVTAGATGDPVGRATVEVSPGDRTLTTDADGTFGTRLAPGTYELSVSVFGFEDARVSDVVVSANSFTPVAVPLQHVPSGQLTGTVVFDESGHGVPNATIRVLDVPRDVSATSGADGRYTIPLVPAGNYAVEVDHPSFTAPEPSRVTVTAEGSTTANFTLTRQPPSVAIVSYPESYAQPFLDHVFTPAGIPATIYSYSELEQAARHPVVVIGYNISTGTYNRDRFQAMLDATDASGAGVLFLDYATGTLKGIGQLSKHTGQPEATWSTAGWIAGEDLRYEVTEEHPIFGDRKVGDNVMLAPVDSDLPKWAAWFAGYEGDGRRIIGMLDRNSGTVGGGVAIDQRANNRHVLLSMHGADPDAWTPDAKEIFYNAIDWAAPEPQANAPHFAAYDLTVSPDDVQVGEPVCVAARVKNVGSSAGTYDAELTVRGSTFAVTPVTLAAGASTTVGWTVTPDAAGTYPITVGPLSNTFRARTPVGTLTPRAACS